MQAEKFQYYPISLIAAIFVGIDVGIVSFLFTYATLGVVGGMFIAVCGCLLNLYVYHEAGPETIRDLMDPESEGGSRLVDIISILGGLLIFFFTLSAYKDLTLASGFVSFWFTPFIVVVMAAAYFIATFALNKIGLLSLVKDSQKSLGKNFGVLELCNSWAQEFSKFFNKEWGQGIMNFCAQVIVPLFVATVVTYAYTHVFTIGALALFSNWQYQLFWQSLVYISSVAFFIGELYFNCDQNIKFMQKCRELFSETTTTTIGLVFVIFANAVANAFIALEGPLNRGLTLWGGLKFFCGGIQSFCTMSARCILEFAGWEKFFGKEPGRLAWWTLLVLDVLLIVNLMQVPYVLPIYMNPLSYCVILLVVLMIGFHSSGSKSAGAAENYNMHNGDTPSTSGHINSPNKGTLPEYSLDGAPLDGYPYDSNYSREIQWIN
ncbi:MAG: hypothetical protein P8L77_04170 [Gammaproteobacteria bacterium]|nr:hypothetical protein [Gammaproteobacteria bacterium]